VLLQVWQTISANTFLKGYLMNRSILVSTLFLALSLTACDKPTVVNVPAATIAVPGPAGPAGETGAKGDVGTKGNTGNQGDTGNQGNTGAQGNQGETGKAGDGTTVIVVPPAEPATGS
jgi:Collagen triple helix repeat (20 copies)